MFMTDFMSFLSRTCRSLIHITPCVIPLWLGKMDEIHPILLPPGIPAVRVTCSPSTSSDHVYFYLQQHKSTIKLLYYASSLLFSLDLSGLMSEYQCHWLICVLRAELSDRSIGSFKVFRPFFFFNHNCCVVNRH